MLRPTLRSFSRKPLIIFLCKSTYQAITLINCALINGRRDTSRRSHSSLLKVWPHQYVSPLVGDRDRLPSAERRRRARPHAAALGIQRRPHQGGGAAAAQGSSLSLVRPRKPAHNNSLRCAEHEINSVDILVTVTTRAGHAFITLQMQDTPKLWTFSCPLIPNYWINQMRTGYGF